MSSNKKIKVGDYAYLAEDGECGWVNTPMQTPAEIEYEITCKYLNQEYVAWKCECFDGCDFKTEIHEHDYREYPDLFKP